MLHQINTHDADTFFQNNNGIQIDRSAVLYSVNKDEKVENYYYDLEPGIYEVDVDGFFLATDPSTYNLAVEFLSIQTVDSKVDFRER